MTTIMSILLWVNFTSVMISDPIRCCLWPLPVGGGREVAAARGDTGE